MRLFGVLIGATTIALAVNATSLRAALTDAERIAFEVFRGGDLMGSHEVAFRQDGDELHVEIDIELEVTMAFITVFEYRHRNHEIWRDGRLIAIETETDDDGTQYWLRGQASEAGFEVDGSNGSFIAPADVMPTSYWNIDTVDYTQLLDTQRGRLIDVDIVPAGSEAIVVEGKPVEAERFTVTGDLTLDVWYTPDNEWAKITFEARGAEVVYAR